MDVSEIEINDISNDNIDIKTEEETKPSTSGSVLFPNETKYSHIKNKHVRLQQFQKSKREKTKVSIQCTFLLDI